MLRLSTLVLIIILLSCGEDRSSDKKSYQTKRKEKSALTLIRQDDCLNCHSIEDKTIGPAYIEIARKYGNDEETVQKLAEKIIEGGGGLWGGAQMSKHQFLKRPNALKIVKWILSLDEPLANQAIDAEGGLLSSYLSGPAGSGLVLSAFVLNQNENLPMQGFPDVGENVSPQFEVTIPALNFKNNQAFLPLRDKFFLQIKGKIKIDTGGKYFFRLDKTGTAMMKMDGRIIISDDAKDREISLDLEAGEYTITISYLSKTDENYLSLYWIPPDAEYFQEIAQEIWVKSEPKI